MEPLQGLQDPLRGPFARPRAGLYLCFVGVNSGAVHR